MSKLFFELIACLWIAPVQLSEPNLPKHSETASSKHNTFPDSRQMESELRKMNWDQFRFIIESIPKLRSDIEAFGPAGWQFVKSNYMNYRWKPLIDNLNLDQLFRLDKLIQNAQRSS